MPIYELKVIEQKTVATNTVEFCFEKPANFHFQPGQYGGFTLINQETRLPITRRFSLLSAPNEPTLRIATRIQTSDFKKALLVLKPMDTIKFAGPTGTFTLHEDTNIPAVLLAGGIGITPFHSMIQSAVQTNQSRAIVLFYGNNTHDEAPYLDELQMLAKKHAFLTVIPVLHHAPPEWQGEHGFITASLIDNYFDCNKPAIFYACGSPAMINAMKQMLAELNIDEKNIKVEDFPGY